MPTFTQDFPEFRNIDSGNESVNRIRRSYATQDAERARAARRRMQEGIQRDIEAQNDGQAREWEARRRARDVRQRGRSESRELIDGRGSIDSRAFNERREIVGYTIDERDRHDPMLDTTDSSSRWRSRDSYDISRQNLSSRGHTRQPRPTQIGLQGGAMGSKRNFAASNAGGGIPFFVKVAVPIIIVLIVILVFLLTP